MCSKTVERIRWILLGIFVILLPWTKLELVERFAASEIVFLALVLSYGTHWPGWAKRFWHDRTLRTFAVLLLLWVIACGVSGVVIQRDADAVKLFGGFVYLAALSLFVSMISSRSEGDLEAVTSWSEAMLAISALAIVGGSLAFLWYAAHPIPDSQYNFGSLFFSRSEKLIGPFERSNQLAGFIVMFAPLAYELALSQTKRSRQAVYGGGLVLMLVGLVMTASRAGFLSLGACALLYIPILILRKRYRALVIMLQVLMIGTALLLVLSGLWPGVSRIVTSFDDVVAAGQITDGFRLRNWSQAIHAFLESPLHGIGLTQFDVRYQHEVHNTLLAVLAEMGLIGFLPFLSTIVFIGVLAIRNVVRASRWNRRWMPWCWGLLMGMAAEFIFATQHVMHRSRHIWLAFGLVVALSITLKRRKEEEVGTQSRHAV